MEQTDILKIWNECKVHNRKAQSVLYKIFSKKMYAVCLRYAQTTLEADDILQNSFIKIFSKHDLYEGTGSLEGWIKRIVINTAIEMQRQCKRQFIENLENFHAQDVSTVGVEQTGFHELLNLVQQLPLGYKSVFNLYVIEGYSHKEIAEILQISEGNSKSQLSRARQWLQGKLINATT